jgi:hypothetical protein
MCIGFTWIWTLIQFFDILNDRRSIIRMWTEFAENDVFSWDFEERRHQTWRGGQRKNTMTCVNQCFWMGPPFSAPTKAEGRDFIGIPGSEKELQFFFYLCWSCVIYASVVNFHDIRKTARITQDKGLFQTSFRLECSLYSSYFQIFRLPVEHLCIHNMLQYFPAVIATIATDDGYR